MKCPHGEPDPSCCIDCIEGPPAPKSIARKRLKAEHQQEAVYPGHCAQSYAHAIAPGDTIRYVEGTGWCCVECAEAP